MTHWKQIIDRIYSEVCCVLVKSCLPTTYEELIINQKLDLDEQQQSNRLLTDAVAIVCSIHRLQEEVEKDRLDQALSRITDVYTHYEEFDLLNTVPELENKQYLSQNLIDFIRKGKRRFGWQNSGGKNGTPEIEIKDWQEQFKKLKKDDPKISKLKASKIIALTNPNYHAETIRKKI